MKIAVASLSDRPVTLEATEPPRELGLSDPAVEVIAPVHIAVKVTRMQEDVLVEGQAATRARVECSRCLEGVEFDVVGQFEALYVPEGGAYSKRAGRRDFEWGDQRVNFYKDFTIDLADEVGQSVLLEIPMKPLCRPDCAGLCPTCGENLNEGPCNCEADRDDDIWAPLRNLIPPEE